MKWDNKSAEQEIIKNAQLTLQVYAAWSVFLKTRWRFITKS